MGQIMEKCMLISPGDARLGEALTDQADKYGYNVIATVDHEVDNEPDKLSPLYLTWNRRSFLSARNAVVAGINAFKSIETAIIIHESVQDAKPLHELAPVSIDQTVDFSTKGHMFMLRELLAFFVRQGSGNLAMVYYLPGDFTQLPLCAASSGAFRDTVDALSTLYQNEDITINGFESGRDQPTAFAHFIFQTLHGKAAQAGGRWYRFGSSRRRGRSRASFE